MWQYGVYGSHKSRRLAARAAFVCVLYKERRTSPEAGRINSKIFLNRSQSWSISPLTRRRQASPFCDSRSTRAVRCDGFSENYGNRPRAAAYSDHPQQRSSLLKELNKTAVIVIKILERPMRVI